MATTTPMRIPWRGVVRGITKSTSTTTSKPAARFITTTRTRDGRDGREGIDGVNGVGRRRYATESSPEAQPSSPASTSKPPADLPPFSPSSSSFLTPSSQSPTTDPRTPLSVQAAYLRPLRRPATYGVPSCDLQLRSYSVRNLEFFADFCMRAAYYLGLPAFGPVPLPRITERWTVPRGSFIHKKSQENFERWTLRRLIQIKDGNPETVEIWLAFIQKHAYYGIGMKANVWAFEKLGVGAQMDKEMERMRGEVDTTLSQFAFKKDSMVEDKVLEMVNREDFRAGTGLSAPMLRMPVEKVKKHERTTKGV